MIIHDRLYHSVEITDEELRLLRTREFVRLRQVSLSAVPVWTIPVGTCDSKAMHSVGAAHLAKVLAAGRPEFRPHARELFCACLVHDIATPPFSHISEHFMKMLLGKSHEEYAADVLQGSELAREIRRFGVGIDALLDYVCGRRAPIGAVVSGSIDLDNLDNTLRYGLSLGILPRNISFYSPERLAAGFTLQRGGAALDESALPQLFGWARCRETTYAFTYGPENLAPCAMIFRALDLAYREGELPESFFRMRDEEAYEFLETGCNRRTGALARRARAFSPYHLAYAFSSGSAGPELKEALKDPKTRFTLADEIARRTAREPEDVAVYAGQNRAYKNIDLPVVCADGSPAIDSLLPQMKATHLVHVYLRESHPGVEGAIEEIVKSRLPL